MNNHLQNHIFKPELKSDNTLHVIGVCSNIARWHSRYRIAREWIEHLENTPNVKLYLVEAAYGDRQHEITIKDEPNHRLIRINCHAWIKENLINIGVNQLLPYDWKYLCWSDMDVFWRDQGWAQECLHQLQEFNVIQPWSQCADLGFHGNIVSLFHSFGFIHQRGDIKQKRETDYYQYAHSGFAWACTREFWENLPRGLMDFCVLGSADWHMAWAMINDVDSTLYANIGPNYNRRAREWQHGAVKTSGNEVGFVKTRIEHAFHGPKKRRFYKSRNQILRQCGYDPDKHLKYDEQGVIRIVGNEKLDQMIRKYNRSRMEDSILEE